MRQLLTFVPDGDQILLQKCKKLSVDEIKSEIAQDLIENLIYTVTQSRAGVGLSANQVGETAAISVVAIKPTPARPQLKPFRGVYINPKITETFGEKTPMWEGCLSTAVDENGEAAMAQVPRYRKIKIVYYDRSGKQQVETIEGFLAHALQHEIDHLNGILFTSLIDKSSLISYREYIKKFAR